MDGSVIASIVTGVFTIVAIIITNVASNKEVQGKFDKQLAVFEERVKIEVSNLKKEVEKHNSIVERTYSVEARTDVLEEKVRVANHRIEDLERSK